MQVSAADIVKETGFEDNNNSAPSVTGASIEPAESESKPNVTASSPEPETKPPTTDSTTPPNGNAVTVKADVELESPIYHTVCAKRYL